MPAVSLEHVSKIYRRYTDRPAATTLKSFVLRDLWRRKPATARTLVALDDVSFSIPKGRAFGVVGRNGAGKSTLLKLITHILKPDSGTIHIEGRVAALIELGAGFHPELTGRENIFINGIILGLSKREVRARMDAIIEFAELREFIDDPVRTYSNGMCARLGFAVAINVDPDVLIIDEVLSVGDIGFTRKCKARLEEFKSAGKTILLVTHDVGMVASWCDEALWLEHGKVKSIGPSQRVVDAYLKSLEVASEGPVARVGS